MSDTPIADMVEQMLSGGFPPDKILLAIRAVEQTTSNSRKVDPTAAKRRAWDRERQQRLRAQQSTRQDKTHSLSSSPSVEKENKKERKSGIVCPPDFHPTHEHYQLGQSLSYPRSRVDSMCDDMKSWSHANANRAIARKADWNLTFTGWLKRNAKPTNGAHNGKRSLSDAADERLARAAENDRTIDLGAADYFDAGFEVGERPRG